MAELLLELLSEEIPARMQARAAEELKKLVTGKLSAAGLAVESARAFVTPRRLALVVEGLPERQPDVTEEKKGPKVGAPEQALAGFMKANGLADIAEAEVRETDKGSFYFVVRRIEGRDTALVLPEILAAAIGELGWPKSMRWAENAFRWVRPLQGVVALFDGEALAGAVELGRDRVAFGATTVGHRFLAPAPFAVSGFADYQAKLARAFVLLAPAERRAAILEQARALAEAEGLTLKEDPGLLDEVAGLVEWPVALVGRIPQRFMAIPPEVLTTSMKAHQRYLSLETPDGALADRFVVVANISADAGSERRRNIVGGNERVLSARLSDAAFFWDQDRRRSLQSRVGALADIVFHAKLGTLQAKVERIVELAVALSGDIPGAGADAVRSAAELCKADLTTGMVGEFPELQGVMGRYYARHDGETPEVAEAIAEHYAPLGPGDRCPTAPTSVAVALADKIDTLVGFWAIDEKPTGSKDPYALRRAALGVIRLIVENGLRLSLTRAFETAQQGYRHLEAAPVAASLLDFLADRLKVALREQGVRHDLISAVFATGRTGGGREDDLVRLLAEVEALGGFLAGEDGANLLVAYRRAANIVRIEEKKDKARYEGAVAAPLLQAPEEQALAMALEEAEEQAAAALAREDFVGAMRALALLRRPLDAFFDKVTVNAEEPALRENRLRLLARIGGTLGTVADFSLIEG
ncbi:glycyl-tRNA synthetase beta chain [Tistlia consotensis]|uniref:Glycine--tRNA ligase beta subunit n=1 Tax=Tistlia consotensis USBA 355 TaxID=560819 RepID=A0A1Y6B3E6_9PROT|nr:glycine--tRNA ligase subunit beta [Tistlia consotensis]SME89451.1 glycyl-tRNA synthetase beta chain [Tistlia consotensis USBA 355]SNR25976.1 glycyl-tRNA synthetase beta chain [Tistlia consotensis]